MKELLVIIPAYNEEENIYNVIQELKQDVSYADILVINDCSTDRTLAILEENNIKCLSTPFNLGYAAVVQSGFKYAALNEYEYVAQFDGDGQHIAAELNKLYENIRHKDTDIIVGSRFKKTIEYKHSFFRKIGTGIFQSIIKWTCGKEITDPTSGMQVLNQRVYCKYAKMYNYPDYPDANLIIEMFMQGYKIEEVPVQMRERTAGVSMHAGVWHPIKYMIKMFYSIALIIAKYKPLNNKKDITIVRGINLD